MFLESPFHIMDFNKTVSFRLQVASYILHWRSVTIMKHYFGCISACNVTSSDPSGTFESPDYPFDYPPDSYCQYLVEVIDASFFKIEFRNFQLELATDFLHYGSGTIPDVTKALGTFSGSRVPDPFVVQGQNIWFLFTSNSERNYQGFSLKWDTKRKYDVSINGH